MVSNIEALALILLLRYMAHIFESSSLALLDYALLVLWIVFLIWQLLALGGIKVKIRFPFPTLEKNQPSHLLLEVENKRLFRQRALAFLVEYRGLDGRKKYRKWLKVSAVPRKLSEYQFAFQIEAAGSYTFRIRKIRVYDFFGLFYQNFHTKSQGKVTVLPEIHEIPVTIGQRITQFWGDSDVYDLEHPGYDPSEVYEIREFRDGDRLPNIHWKISAKMDQLMIKENSLPKACAILLLMNETEKVSEESLERMFSISYSLLCAKCPHYFVWKSNDSGEITRIRVEDEESFYEAILSYMQQQCSIAMENMQQQYCEKYRGEQFIHAILAEGEKILLNGEELSKEQLEALSLT